MTAIYSGSNTVLRTKVRYNKTEKQIGAIVEEAQQLIGLLTVKHDSTRAADDAVSTERGRSRLGSEITYCIIIPAPGKFWDKVLLYITAGLVLLYIQLA